MYEQGDIDEGLRPFITEATDDLAARLAIDPADVDVLSAVLVTWPDASLGCPQPDMQYAQVVTDGSIIELGVGEGDEHGRLPVSHRRFARAVPVRPTARPEACCRRLISIGIDVPLAERV